MTGKRSRVRAIILVTPKQCWRPKGFVTILLFDKDYKFLDAAWDQLDSDYSQTIGSPKAPHDYLTKEVTITEEGYAYVFISNESPTFVDIYFDDVKMTYTPSRVIQYNEYYPFGLQTANSWTRTGSKNDYLYNSGSELNASTGWYDMAFREYDPATGRMLQIDPMTVKYASLTPYNYAFGNPVMWSDPSGADPNETQSYFDAVQNLWNSFHYGSVRDQVKSTQIMSAVGGEGGPGGAGGGVTAEDVALTAFGATEDGWNSLYYYNSGTLYLQSTWRYAKPDEFMLTMACSNCDEVDVMGVRDNGAQQGSVDPKGWQPTAAQISTLLLRMALNLPDAISVSINWTAAYGGVGMNATPIGKVKVLLGPDRGKHSLYGDASVSIGKNISISVVFTEYYYLGPSQILLSDFPGPQLSGGADISPGLGELGMGFSVSKTEDGGYIIGKEHTYSVSPEPKPHFGWNFNFGTQWFYKY